MATIDDVAKAAGVSISTVSYALSGKRSITSATRQRVLEAVVTLGYQPTASARMLAANRSHILAVTAPLHRDTEQTAHMTFALEVTKSARSHGFDTLLLVDDDAVAGMRRTAATSLADGMIILDVDAQDERAELARSLGHPAVFIGIPARTEGLTCVDMDFEAAARLALARLVDLGHRSIALISHELGVLERGSNFPLRFLDGFTAHAEDLGIDYVVTHPTSNRALEPVADVIERLPDVTAIVLNTSADVTSTLVHALAQHGRRVPHDVSVIAAGGTLPTGRLAVPLDEIPIDPQASCWTAVGLLVGAVEAGATTPRTVLIEPKYHEHGSVAPPLTSSTRTS
jgi:DNA-binding LacI/PurR family transcriptional regulator